MVSLGWKELNDFGHWQQDMHLDIMQLRVFCAGNYECSAEKYLK
jgi:hypothetical protein